MLTDYGLLRIEGKDSDALGRESAAPLQDAAPLKDAKEVATAVWDQMKTCFDPEIPVNIVELGLVYENKVEPIPEGGFRVDVKFTLTAPGCGMGGAIASDARQKLLSLPGVTDAEVEVVWDPPWSPQMISPEGKERLGMS